MVRYYAHCKIRFKTFPLLFGAVKKLPLPTNRVAIIKSKWQNSKTYLQHHLFTKDMSLLSKMMGDSSKLTIPIPKIKGEIKMTISLTALMFFLAICIPNTCISKEISGLIAYWSFDEGKGEVVKDLSGNGNDGTL